MTTSFEFSFRSHEEHEMADLRSCTIGCYQKLNFVLDEDFLEWPSHDINWIFGLSKVRDSSLAVTTQIVMPCLILNPSTFGGERIWAALVDVVQTIEDEDQCNSVLAQEGNIVFNGFLETERNAAESVLEWLFVVAVQAQVEVVGSIDTNDSILQRLKMTEVDMFTGPLVELLDCHQMSADEAQ